MYYANFHVGLFRRNSLEINFFVMSPDVATLILIYNDRLSFPEVMLN